MAASAGLKPEGASYVTLESILESVGTHIMSKYAVLFGSLPLCFELYIYNGTIHGKKLFSTINHNKAV